MSNFLPLQPTGTTTYVPVQVRRARLPVALPQVLAVSAALQERADLAYWLPAAEPPAEPAAAAPAAHPAANGAPAGGAQRSTGGDSGDAAEPSRDPDRLRDAAAGGAGEQRGTEAAGSHAGNGAVGEPATADGDRDPGRRPDCSGHPGDVAGEQPPPKERPWLPLALEVRLLPAKQRATLNMHMPGHVDGWRCSMDDSKRT